jgi:hypothetical protein
MKESTKQFLDTLVTYVPGALAALGILIGGWVLAIDQLGLNTSLLNDTVSSVIAITIGGVALAFALGSRGIARDILSSYCLRERFQPGDQIGMAQLGRSIRLTLSSRPRTACGSSPTET